MANKKFYYRNKNKKPQDRQPQEQAETQYTSDQLSLTLEDLGISAATRELLAANRITTSADIVKRTDKDMYKVQGFNKKMLFEVKDALKNAGMALRAEEVSDKPKQAKPSDREQDAKKPNGNTGAKNSTQTLQRQEQRSSKFGLADRRDDARQNKQVNAQTPVRQKPEKLTAPLAIENWRKIMKGGKWGYSDGFKTVIPAMYDEIFGFKQGLASAEIDGKCGYIDGQNNIVIPFDYDMAMSFSEDLAMVLKGDKCGYINKNNEVIIPFEYDAASPFEDGEAKVKKDGKWATLTKDNKLTWI